MTGDGSKPPDASGGFSLRRWSQRKLAAARETEARPAAPSVPPVAPVAASSVPPAPPADNATPSALPSIDSLTTDSDFTAFMRPDVDRGLQHRALRKLFTDPRFNVMDGLDVYVDDYSKPDPISADLVAGLAQARYIFDPPVTRVDEHGFVVDVPPPTPAAPAAQAEASSDVLPDAMPGEKTDAPSAGAIAPPEAAFTLSPAVSPVESEAPESPGDDPKPSGKSDPQ